MATSRTLLPPRYNATMMNAAPSAKGLLPSGSRARIFGFGCACLIVVGTLLAAASPAAPPEPPDYRLDHYRSPTPLTLTGAQVIDTDALLAMPAAGRPVLIDTTPLVRSGLTDFDGTWISTAERWNLPNSLWLPNVGYGHLDRTMQTFFTEQLAKATGGQRDRPILFYCYLDCWMSWNAAKRALEMGYEQVYWYPSGSDGWRDAEQPLVLGQPVPLVLEGEQPR